MALHWERTARTTGARHGSRQITFVLSPRLVSPVSVIVPRGRHTAEVVRPSMSGTCISGSSPARSAKVDWQGNLQAKDVHGSGSGRTGGARRGQDPRVR
jgi:hypothetical protein